MNKKIVKLLTVLLAIAMLAACGSTADTTEKAVETATEAVEAATEEVANAVEEAPAVAAGGFKVASHNAEIEGNPYRVVYENEIKDAVQLATTEGHVSQYATFTANNDPAIESQQIEQTINEAYDIIMVNPIAATGLDPIIDKAIEAGITYINADNEYESAKILNVVVDQKEWARIQSNFVIETLGTGSKVIQFNGMDGNSASEMRNDVWTEELAANGIEVVKTMTHNWDDAEGKRLMGEVISSGLEYDGIINQEGAMGIMNAIEEAKIEYPGCITSSEEVVWIRKIAGVNATEKALPFIVVENPPGIGATALAIGINIRQGNELKDGILTGNNGNSIYYAPQWIMTYENMEERLASIADLPDSTSVSSYLTVEEAKELYFK